jgi:hypothetical protein
MREMRDERREARRKGNPSAAQPVEKKGKMQMTGRRRVTRGTQEGFLSF